MENANLRPQTARNLQLIVQDVAPDFLRSKYPNLYLHLRLFDYTTSIMLWQRGEPSTSSAGRMTEQREREGTSDSGQLPSPIQSSVHTPTQSFAQSSDTQRSDKAGQEQDVLINKVRVHYVFSQKPRIGEFLGHTRLAIKLTAGSSWNAKLVASTHVYAFKGLSEVFTNFAQKGECLAALFTDGNASCFGYLRVPCLKFWVAYRRNGERSSHIASQPIVEQT
jgi:hypothetical protein